MTGFEPGSFGCGSDHSVNCEAITTTETGVCVDATDRPVR